MTATIEYSSTGPNPRGFLLSALGSAIVHTALLAGLTYLPTPPTVKDSTPTVQVKLVPSPQSGESAPQPQLRPAARARQSSPPAPRSVSPQTLHSTPVPPLQASLKSPSSMPSTLPPPLPQAKTMLKDTGTQQIIKSRQMMKMAVPHRPEQRPSLAPATPHRQQSSMRVPLHLNSQQTIPRHEFPSPLYSNTTALPALKATPPASAGSSTTSPAIVSSSKPLYPRVARESGWEGTVIVRTLITIDGIPSQVEIRKSCGHESLDHAAQEAIKSWKFEPAKDGNIPIAKWVDIPIKFDLNS